MKMRIVFCKTSNDADVQRGVMIHDGFPPTSITTGANVEQVTWISPSGEVDGAANVWVVIGKRD